MISIPWHRWAIPSLFLLVAVVYGWAFPGHFFLDDVEIVQTNLQVYSPDLQTIFTSDYWGAGENTGLFRPLTILSFAFNRIILGDTPSGYLVVNLLLHGSVALLLYLYLCELGVSKLPAWFAAALFAVHPIHGEAVIELVGRGELLAALFSLAVLYLSRKEKRWKEVCLYLSFMAALLSKENGVMVLILIPVVDLFVDRTSWRELLQRRGRLLTILVIITSAWLCYRVFVVHYGIPAPPSVDPYYIPLGTVDAPTRILSALKLQFVYLAKELFPYHLQGMYPVKTVKPFITWLSLYTLTLMTGLFFIGYVVKRGWQRREWWGLAILLYMISFIPTSNILFSAGFTMAERVAYSPSLWFCFGFAVFLHGIVKSLPRKYMIGGVILLLSLYSASGIVRVRDFSSPLTLWRSDLAVDPTNELSMLMLINQLRGERRYVEAAEYAENLLSLTPDFKSALNIYAWLQIDLEQPQAAIPVARHAISLEPTGSVSASQLPLAAALIALKRWEEARLALTIVRTTDINQPVYWELQGKVLEARGDLLGALECFKREAGVSGVRSRDGLFRLGRIYFRLNLLKEAEESLRRDLRLNPKNAEGWSYLGRVQNRLGKRREAGESWQQAINLQPESIEYRQYLQQEQ